MRSTPAGEPADSRGLVLALVALGLLAAAVVLDLGYYAPRRGVLSGGTAAATSRDAELGRNRAVVKIVPEMAQKAGLRPTLADAIRFFGLEQEVLRCSALATAGEEEMEARRLQALERQPRAVGDSVTLCLD
jgi:hypothetical protein